jgi:type I restriction-modification system DNA methylase subunit
MAKEKLTEDKAEDTPAGGVLVGKRNGQTMIHNKGSLSGYLVGKTHAQGGIQAINKSTGQPLEMQGGEIIITAPAVSDNTKNEFNGKMMTNREILSQINVKGGGVAFAKDGMEIPKRIKRTGASYNYSGKTMTDHEIYKYITGGGIAEDFKYSKEFSGITIYTDVEQEYVGNNYSPFENKGSFKATITKGGLENIALESKYLQNFNFKYGVDNWNTISKKLKDNKITKLELYQVGKYVKTFELKPIIEKNNSGGHLSKGMTLPQIAKKHKVSLKELQKQVDMGMKAESEHTSSKREQMKIVKDHLYENPKYYSLLKKAGLEDGGKLESLYENENDYIQYLVKRNLTIAVEEYKLQQYLKSKDLSTLGLLPDNVKKDPEYIKIKRDFDIAFKKLQNIPIYKYPKNRDRVQGQKDLRKANEITDKILKIKLKNKSYATGGTIHRGSLVRDAKSGNTPARDLNNYNDVLDLDADGMVGAETGLYADGGMFNTEPFLNYYFDEIAEFLKYQNNITLNKDFTFKYKGELFRVEPIVLSEKNIKEAYFSIIDSDDEEVGDIVFNPNNNKKFEANSDFFDWNNIKFYDGGDIKPYDANMEGDSADMMYAGGGITDYENKTLDELRNIKNSKYSDMPIDSPKSEDEKLLDKLIAEKFSLMNQEIKEKRKSFESEGSTEGKGKLYEFFTPQIVADKMLALAQHYGFKGGNVLEPATGSGRLIKNLKNTNITAFEISKDNFEILKREFPNAELYNFNFEKAFLKEPRFNTLINRKGTETWLKNAPFDLVLANPPYGKFSGLYSSYFNFKGQVEHFFILQTLYLLKKGGLGVYLIPSSFLRNGVAYNEIKKQIFEIAEFVDAYRLPSNIFEKTQIGTDILILRKK